MSRWLDISFSFYWCQPLYHNSRLHHNRLNLVPVPQPRWLPFGGMPPQERPIFGDWLLFYRRRSCSRTYSFSNADVNHTPAHVLRACIKTQLCWFYQAQEIKLIEFESYASYTQVHFKIWNSNVCRLSSSCENERSSVSNGVASQTCFSIELIHRLL